MVHSHPHQEMIVAETPFESGGTFALVLRCKGPFT